MIYEGLTIDSSIPTYYIENYGCQMNVADTQEIHNIMKGFPFQRIENPEQADIIIINSCAVRQTAEDRIFNRMAYFNHYKQKKGTLLILFGCLAQKEIQDVKRKIPFVDLVIGPAYKKEVPEIIQGYLNQKEQHPPLFYQDLSRYQWVESVPDEKVPIVASITIIHGCNNFCSYCIVPLVRGREISKPSKQIFNEAYNLVENGVKELLLLGQNVNSYGKDNQDISFADLLVKLSSINGVKRIRFLTSHPKDFSDELIEVVASENKVCQHIHLPLQSGSNRILRLMNRQYTYENYQRIINALRERMSDLCSLTTDLLVGFPGETYEDFQQTLNAVKQIEFDESFTFQYNMRPLTKASKLKEEINSQEKVRRLQELIAVQKNITHKKFHSMIGTKQVILLERISKKNPEELLGRTDDGKNVIVKAPDSWIGKMIEVRLNKIVGLTYKGEVLNKDWHPH